MDGAESASLRVMTVTIEANPAMEALNKAESKRPEPLCSKMKRRETKLERYAAIIPVAKREVMLPLRRISKTKRRRSHSQADS